MTGHVPRRYILVEGQGVPVNLKDRLEDLQVVDTPQGTTRGDCTSSTQSAAMTVLRNTTDASCNLGKVERTEGRSFP